MPATDSTIRQKLEAAVIRRHERYREELRSKGAIFNDELNALLAAELSQILASLDDTVASIEAWRDRDPNDAVH